MTRTIFLQSYHVAQQFATPALQDRLRIDVALFALKEVKDGNEFFRRHWDLPPKAQKNPRAVPGDIPDLQIMFKKNNEHLFRKSAFASSHLRASWIVLQNLSKIPNLVGCSYLRTVKPITSENE